MAVVSPVPVRTTGPLSAELAEVLGLWARSQQRIVVLAARFAASSEWIVAGAPTAAHWLAAKADVEASTAREWLRIGRRLAELPLISAAFADGRLSYSKVRTLTRIATSENEVELLPIAVATPASNLGVELARWLHRNSDPRDLAAYHHHQRSVTWRVHPDGMVVFTLRLPPLLAGTLVARLETAVMTRRSTPQRDQGASADAMATAESERDGSAGAFASLAQQRADAIDHLLANGNGRVMTEVVVHVRGDGCTMDDGSPVPDSVVAQIAPTAFIRALIHDAAANPVDASPRRRLPTERQKRVVKERDRHCVDCGTGDLLEFDHVPAYEFSEQTITAELRLRCAPCHRRRHRIDAA
ncbi:HNH endonuclease signature motif containing protein [soil metagenome]